MRKKLSNESFIEQSKVVHEDKYDYSKVVYRGNKEKVIIICPIHGEFEKIAGDHLSGQGCRVCKGYVKLNKQSFESRAIEKHGLQYDYSLSEIRSKKDKITIICRVHGPFNQLPGNHMGGQGCPKCGRENAREKQKYTKEEFINTVKDLYKDKYDYSQIIYVNSQTKIEIICPIHGSFKMKPNSHYNGQGCSKCGRIKAIEKIKLDYDEFIYRATKIHENAYKYIKRSYINYTTKMTIECKIHGKFNQIPHSHISMKAGCPKCGINKAAENNKISISEFISRFRKVHGDLYEYYPETILGATEKMKINCIKHGDFHQTPTIHQKGGGCSSCAYEKNGREKKITLQEFLDKAKAIHGLKYDYSHVFWDNQHSKIEIGCIKHGLFNQTPRNHLRGSGCPFCNSSKGEEIIRIVLAELGVRFNEQQIFEGLKDKRSLKCDFYLPDFNLVLEYNGIQHYKSMQLWGGEEAFKQGKKRDKIKEEFCRKNSIGFEVIKYDQDIRDRLDEILGL